MGINEKYKDSVFRKLFGDPAHKENLLSLFNALNGTSYDDKDELEINTISDAVYMGIKNDVSCILDCQMILFEHQSTYNPNMPIRGLIYFASLYDKYIESNDLNKYSESLVKIPTPRYYVLYNGEREMPDRMDLRLSDAFEHADETAGYEWTATMLNINYGHNRELMESCSILEEYAKMVSVIRECVKADSKKRAAHMCTLEDSIARGLEICISQGILADFLRTNKAEVMGMFLTHYDQQKTNELFKEEYIKIGEARGMEKGREEGRKEGEILLVFKFVSKGYFSPARGAQELGLSEEEFISRMMEEGFKSPDKQSGGDGDVPDTL